MNIKIKTSGLEWLNRAFTGVGFVVVALTFFNIFRGHSHLEGLFVGLLGAAAGVYGIKTARKLRNKQEELGVLRFMALRNGLVSAPEVMLHFGITAERAKETLERLQNHGIIMVEVTSKGELLYSAQDSLSQSERFIVT